MAACRGKGLKAVAITDHHDLAFVEYIREAARSEVAPGGAAVSSEDRLIVFPGVELTLAVPGQALLLLDADFPDTHLAKVLGLLSIEQTDAAEAKAGDPVRIGHIQSLSQLHEELDRHEWLRGSYIVLPNVTDSGHETILRSGMQQKYIEMPSVGGYVDGPAAKGGTGKARILAGQDEAWGRKAIAVIQTSDSRKASFEHLGEHATWIKWATPTAEALRQACLAKESRIAHSEPELPSVVVTRLSVSNSRFMGPVELELNPQYNAIIGGRGTGKSTCLEYLRWALCDQPAQHRDDDETPDHALRRERLIAHTLADFDGQYVEVHLLVNGIPHVVRRRAETSEVLLKVGSGPLETATPDDIRGLLAIQAYSQKQLSSVGVRIDELSRFVTAPIAEQLDDLASRQDELAARVRENFVVLQRQRALTRSTTHDALLLESLTQQTASLRDGLNAVTPEDQATLTKKAHFDASDRVVQGWTRSLEQAEQAVTDFEAAIGRARSIGSKPDSDDAIPHAQLLTAIEGALRDVLASVETTAAEARTRVADHHTKSGGLAALLDTWRQEREAFEREYAAAAERSVTHSGKLEELAAMEKRKSSLQDTLERQREELSRLHDAEAVHEQLRSDWRDLQAKRSDAIDVQCKALTELSGELIRATLRKSGSLEELEDRLKTAITGSKTQGAKVAAFVTRISEDDEPLKAWQEAMDQLEGAVLARDDPAPSALDSSALTPFTASEIEKMAARLTPEALLELSLIPMQDRPSFEYRRKEDEYIGFERASAGQQATALLRVLLNQNGPPLIIDQPEDDLDSQVMLELVDQLWDAKRRRQLIFTSHNANLVVNGDAELVLCCDYRAAGDQSGAQVKLSGAIDIPKVRDEITVVMEGGEKAFRLRKEKYGF